MMNSRGKFILLSIPIGLVLLCAVKVGVVVAADDSSPVASSTETAASSTPEEIPDSASTSFAEATDALSTDMATSTDDDLTCTSAYTADLFDTPSGHEAPGANRIGTQAWTDCKDTEGHTYEFKMTPQEYAALAQPNAPMPLEEATSSAKVTPISVTDANTNADTATDVPVSPTPETTVSSESTVASTTSPADTESISSTTPIDEISSLNSSSSTPQETTPDANLPAEDTATTTGEQN